MKIYYSQFLEFTRKNYRDFVFVALFYSLWLVYKVAVSFDPQLFSFPERMIGEATLNGYDISKRIGVFYKSGALFFSGLIFFSFLYWRIILFSRRIQNSAELKILNYSSLAGVTFYFFQLWTQSFNSSLALIYCIHIVALLGIVIKKLILKNKPASESINVSVYAMLFVIAVSVFFIQNEMIILFELLFKPNFSITIFISALIALLIIAFSVNQKSLDESNHFLNRFAFLLIPITCIPVLSFLKDEVYLILNRHQISFFTPRSLYILFLLAIAILMMWQYKRLKKGKGNVAKSIEQLVALRYFPLLVVGLSSYAFYNPIIDISNEMFESGNKFLPLMELQKFGVIPIIEKFNSHVLSELFFGGIYSFFNGLHSREMFIYDFIYQVFWAFMVYVFIYRISRSAYIALFTIFLFPLIDNLLLDYTIISLITIYVTAKVVNEAASFKNYFLLIACLTFLLVWRVDIGYPSIVASFVTLLVYLINREQFRINWKLLLKVAGSFLVIVVTTFIVIGIYRHINVFDKFRNGMNYLASAQTYGLTSYGDMSKSTFKIQYFVFPLIIILGMGAMLISFKRLNVSRPQRFIYISFLFLLVYYFVNFQRGVVRHSFNEGNDNSLSAFVFFIFSGSVFLFAQPKSKVFKFIAFITISTFVMMNYKFPAPVEFKNLYAKAIEKAGNFNAIKPQPNIVRCIDPTNFEQTHYVNFKKLISEQLNNEQTFIDFSNTPMLYYLTEKISPSYFYQNPLTIHNDYLQQNFLADIKNYDAPLIIFSNFPSNWWDNVDGVPNSVRHYKMAEYFFNNYQPFSIVDSLCIWKRINFKASTNEILAFSYVASKDSIRNEQFITGSIKADNKNCIFKLKAQNFKDPNDHVLSIKIGDKTLNIKPAFIDETNQMGYYILLPQEKVITFQLKNEEKSIYSLHVYTCDYVPDFYSSQPKHFDLKQLPFIWASYDKTVHQENVLKEILSTPQTVKKDAIQYVNFSADFDKSSGNIILISLECENDTPAVIELMYGSSKKGYKGSFSFTVPKGKGVREFAVRMSTQYKWYDIDVDYIACVNKETEAIKLDKITLLKGN